MTLQLWTKVYHLYKLGLINSLITPIVGLLSMINK
jgi:uncharacterized membrane protein